uniref:Serine/arginine repetitive matrix 4 n=1 Tax=Anser cygnoides TaxID=8845 RepID=A0A8B9EHA8_ANSCY
MAGVQQGEKQLFEKFWRGTFKAVATPRPESIIVASITARKPLPGPQRGEGAMQPLTPLCPPRSPSYSPSPVKKKKKKSSKKRKRNRYFSFGNWLSTKLSRVWELVMGTTAIPRSNGLVLHVFWRHRARSREEGRKTRRRCSRHHSKVTAKRSSSAEVQANQKASQTLPLYSFLSPKEVISQSGSSADLFTKTDSPPGNLASQNGEYHEYDSGNDTSSPPSTQTSSSRSKDSQEKRSLVHDGFGHALSSGKPKLANSDNSSDSGNSFTSCFSQTKATALENLSPDAQGQDRRACLSLCLSCSEEKKRDLSPSPAPSSPARPCSRSESYSSTGRSSPGSSRSSRSRSSHHRASPKYSRSRSCSSGKRALSFRVFPFGAACLCGSFSVHSTPTQPTAPARREHKYGSSEKESHRERDRRRRCSYSPLRKRRRDSPSHLEARRITSARKRPIPYYRPSPSSSSSASSYSSWYSTFSRSPSRSRSYSSSRTSRSRSWSSSSGEGRSRSRSSGPRSSRSRSRSSESGGSSDSLRR